MTDSNFSRNFLRSLTREPASGQGVSTSAEQIKCLVSYGIGHVGTSRIARIQYTHFLIIRDFLGESLGVKVRAFLFDPVLTPDEKAAIEADDVTIIPENEECRRCVENDASVTLFYMPHCDRPMYENVLWANWRPDLLSRVVFFGNSFRLIGERVPSSRLKEETPLLAKLVKRECFEEKTVDVDSSIDDDVFNDCALTWFPKDTLLPIKEEEAEFWEKSSIPISCTPAELR